MKVKRTYKKKKAERIDLNSHLLIIRQSFNTFEIPIVYNRITEVMVAFTGSDPA